jgi:hypothetical protein
MTTARCSRLLFSLALMLLVSAVGAAPAAARQHRQPAAKTKPKAKATPQEPTAASDCQHPCTHVDDCPKVTCECSQASASGVAACDTEETHCCTSTETACTRFCEMHQQSWTGRFTADGAAAAPAPATAASPAPCNEPCDKAEDCRTMTCQCAKDTAENVAACDPKGHCCAEARIVCEHYCTGKKGKWTGKAVDTPPPSDGDRGLGEPPDDGLGEPPDDDGLDDDGGGDYSP